MSHSEMSTNQLLFIDFACNNPDNGDFTGLCEKIELPDGSMTLDCRLENGGVKIDFAGGLSFGHLKLTHHGHKSWVGNWCWEGCWLTVADTLKLVTYIKSLKHWGCDGGWCAICDPWEAGTLTEDILRAELLPSGKGAAHAGGGTN